MSESTPSASLAPAVMDLRKLAVPVLLVVVLMTIAYWSMFEYAEYKWSTDDNYSHGYFVPVAVLYLIWRKRENLKLLPIQGNAWGLALVLFALVIHAMGVRADLLRISMISFILLIYGLVLFFAGKAWLRAILFPVGFLIFAFPLPLYIESITFPMKLAAAKVSVAIMDAIGMSIFREGTVIYLPTMTMGVADACSGLRSLVLVTGVAVFYAYVYIETTFKRILFVLLAMPIALIANIARILMTGLVGYFAGYGKLFDLAHDGSGLFVLVVAGLSLVIVDSLMIYFSSLWNKKQSKPAQAS